MLIKEKTQTNKNENKGKPRRKERAVVNKYKKKYNCSCIYINLACSKFYYLLSNFHYVAIPVIVLVPFFRRFIKKGDAYFNLLNNELCTSYLFKSYRSNKNLILATHRVGPMTLSNYVVGTKLLHEILGRKKSILFHSIGKVMKKCIQMCSLKKAKWLMSRI